MAGHIQKLDYPKQSTDADTANATGREKAEVSEAEVSSLLRTMSKSTSKEKARGTVSTPPGKDMAGGKIPKIGMETSWSATLAKANTTSRGTALKEVVGASAPHRQPPQED